MTTHTITRTALVGGRVLLDDECRSDLAVVIAGEQILGVFATDAPEVTTAQQQQLHGRLLLPGFIDIQVNGGGGLLFNDAPTVETLRSIAAAHWRYGTTGLLPTLITTTDAKMREATRAVAAAIDQAVAGILGIHLEGPYLAPARQGIHDASLFRHPQAEDLAWLATPRHGAVMLTLAPEQVAAEAITALAQAGVIVCAGHTAADYATIRTALGAGLSGFTHVFNAMTPLTSREPGVVGAALDDPASWCGLIVDGHHVHPASLRVAIAAKPRGKSVLVTDAMPPVGAPEYFAYRIDGQLIEVHDGACRNAAGVLAGSALDMASALRNTVRMLQLPLPEASRMASRYPAEWLRLGASHGRIAAGYRADFAVLDDDLRNQATWIGGRQVFKLKGTLNNPA